MRFKKDIFSPIKPLQKLGKSFKAVMENPGYLPARMMLNEAFEYFDDTDGNFIEQFQTKGFDARLWELYLNMVLIEQNFAIDRNNVRPDFRATKNGQEIFIENVTTGPSEANATMAKPKPTGEFLQDVFNELEYTTIRIGGSLFSKLQKKYWQLEYVKDKLLILAIEAFHDEDALHFNDATLSRYLYGLHSIVGFDEMGNLTGKVSKIPNHRSGRKVIPSGFFSSPDAKHISAIIFSNSGTISKFNRLGYLKGYGRETVSMKRFGLCYNPDPNATVPFQFEYVVGDPNYPENWSQGLHLFHNPYAINPLPKDYSLFEYGISQHFVLDNEPYGLGQPLFCPMSSKTLILPVIT